LLLLIAAAAAAACCPQAYAFQGYWEDIGTIDAFFNANLALVKDGEANFSFYDKDAPIYTMSRFLPPSKILDGEPQGVVRS
jgi:glucose-1-phosphate adenylyltransferase